MAVTLGKTGRAEWAELSGKHCPRHQCQQGLVVADTDPMTQDEGGCRGCSAFKSAGEETVLANVCAP